MADQEMALAGLTRVALHCDSCDMSALLPQERQGFTCPRCKLVVLLEEKVSGASPSYSGVLKLKFHQPQTARIAESGNQEYLVSEEGLPEPRKWRPLICRKCTDPLWLMIFFFFWTGL
ncbi:Choline transporter-like protein 3, partial [Varanus komodoensis]